MVRRDAAARNRRRDDAGSIGPSMGRRRAVGRGGGGLRVLARPRRPPGAPPSPFGRPRRRRAARGRGRGALRPGRRARGSRLGGGVSGGGVFGGGGGGSRHNRE